MHEAVFDSLSDESKAMMLDVLSSTVSFSIYFKDTAGRHIWINDHMVESLKGRNHRDWGGVYVRGREDILGKTDAEVYGTPGGRITYEDDMKVIETGEPIIEKEESSDDGSTTQWRSTTKAPWRDENGTIVGLVGMTVNIFEAKRKEKLEEFASVVSHDLRNPLTVASGNLALAREENETEHLRRAAESLDHINTLIDDVLTIARDGLRVDALLPTDGESVAREAWSNVETADARLDVDFDQRLMADGDLLVQLFENMFLNCIEHGGNDVVVRVGETETGFFVEDDGPGIPGGEREKIFDWGYSSTDGTGLGLAIVKQITEGHRWGVRATENDGGGARFEFIGIERPPS